MDLNGEVEFSAELRARSRHRHTLSRAVVNMTAPIALSSPTVYRIVLKSFYFVYLTMETEVERLRMNYPKINTIYFRELLRTKAFEEDLAFYYGPNWKSVIGQPSPATKAYIEEMGKAVNRNPILILAFCQTMYVGMLAGGQVTRGWCKRAFGLKGVEGTKAFDFSAGIPDIVDFRTRRYTEAINSLQLTRQERDMIIEQKLKIFLLNDSLFAEVRTSAEYRSRVTSALVYIVGFAILIIITYRLFII